MHRIPLKKFVVRPDGGDVYEPVDVVVVGSTETAPHTALDAARPHLARGRRVRVVGYGCTLAIDWPRWVSSSRHLSVAEPGAYERRSRFAASRDLAPALREWCDDVLGGASGCPAHEIFYGSAAARMFQPVLDAGALADGLLHAHPDSEFEILGGWPGDVLVGTAPRSPSVPRFAVVFWFPLALTGSLARVVRGRWSARRSFFELARRRRTKAHHSPKFWLGLVPDWERANKHLLATLAREATERGDRLGVVLIGTLRAGSRDDHTHQTSGNQLWSGLSWLRDDAVMIEQMVMPEHWGAFASALCKAIVRSIRATSRVITKHPPPFPVSPRALATFLSLDVLRASLAEESAVGVARRIVDTGAPVIFCAANLAELAAAERALSNLGATTCEYMHGVGNDAWHGTAESSVSTRFVWTESDARAMRNSSSKVVVAGIPRSRTGPQRAVTPRILLLTNYFHRDLVSLDGLRERAWYQGEILGVPEVLRARLPALRMAFRWRPHPAENRRLVANRFRSLSDVEMSNSADLQDDLGWATIVIAAHSSTVAEASLAGFPVFVHLRPELFGSPFTDYVVPERSFFSAKEGAELVAAFLTQESREREATVDRRMRERLVGGVGPRRLIDACDEESRADVRIR